MRKKYFIYLTVILLRPKSFEIDKREQGFVKDKDLVCK